MMKKFGFAAAVTLLAASAMASNFRAADQVYVPAAGHVVAGAKTFVSDISVSNVTGDAVTVSVIFSDAQGTQQVFNNVFTLAAGEHREFTDFVATARPNGIGIGGNPLGQLIFNACKSGGSCDITDTTGCPGGLTSGTCPDFRNITVESRIYSVDNGTNPATAPTTGQLFSGYPWYSFVTQEQSQNDLGRVFITGIRVNSAYRTNIGLVNASQFSSTQFRLKLYQGATQIGNDVVTDSFVPLKAVQQGFTAFFPTASYPIGNGLNLWIQVSQENSVATGDASANGCPTGCPGFFAYGSVLDNTTNDATTLEPQYFKSLSDAQLACLFPAPGQTVTCKSTPVLHRSVHH